LFVVQSLTFKGILSNLSSCPVMTFEQSIWLSVNFQLFWSLGQPITSIKLTLVIGDSISSTMSRSVHIKDISFSKTATKSLGGVQVVEQLFCKQKALS
jgi:CDP-diglyceride synthetase